MNNAPTSSVKFLLADDHLVVRQGVQFLIEDLLTNASFTHASDIPQIIKQLKENAFDVLILDAQFPSGISLSALPKIKDLQPTIKILIFTSFEEEDFSLKFMEAGANGFLSKLSEENEIKEAITQILEKGSYIPPLTQKLIELSKHNPNLTNPLSKLSARELEIANLYGKGYGNLEIANQLSLKQNTVSTFKKRVFKKLNIETVVDLIELMKIHYNQ